MSKPQPIWQHLPFHLKEDVVSYLDFKSKCSLRICSKDDQKVVDSRPITIDYFGLNLTERPVDDVHEETPAEIVLRDKNVTMSRFFTPHLATEYFIRIFKLDEKFKVNTLKIHLARGEIYEIPSEESHQGEPSTKRISQLENEENIYDDAITNDSKDDVMGNNEAFESSGCEDDNEPSMDFFNFENAVSYVAAIFLHNNFSDSVAKDIFTIGKVLNQYPSIKLSDVNRKVEEWCDYDPRIYSFCVECKNLLSSSNKCGNLKCGRNGVSQANVSNGNVVVTYSIKKQVQQILDNGEIGDEILTRHTTATSLCSRCVDTPKYKERLRKSIQINPQLLPLLVSINIDGFSRKGTSRGSYWPVFVVVHDLNFGSGKFEEYRPEHVLLSAIIKTLGGKGLLFLLFYSTCASAHYIMNILLVYRKSTFCYQGS
ncbi:hypothetical protein B9Z55_013542 [Caenorhabditis nigoni]|uniref:F-box domain-containing protein n=1 Tax=Caenorhabditis nigoni TaxID=1611254 RepID=A0A2G5U270_9PELO|nr:hypothetical protein B9Z55_013542 [Caenorhabditis nigoni]